MSIGKEVVFEKGLVVFISGIVLFGFELFSEDSVGAGFFLGYCNKL